jgi:hypothetical protein
MLFKSSMNVILMNKELLIFPIVTSIATVAMLLFFFAPAALWPTGHSYFSQEHWHALAGVYLQSYPYHGHETLGPKPVAIVYAAFLYFVSVFVATFFNVAFYNEILAALNGESVSLSRGVKVACSRWKAILMWSLLVGFIGVFLKILEGRNNANGRIIARLVGSTWSIASVFVIPIIVRDTETNNPFTMLKKSAGTLTRTWGEGLIGFIGIGALNTIVMMFLMISTLGLVIATSKLHDFWLSGVVMAGSFVLMMLWIYLTNVASLVYKGALYLYAAEGTVSEPYDQQVLDSAWRYKNAH